VIEDCPLAMKRNITKQLLRVRGSVWDCDSIRAGVKRNFWLAKFLTLHHPCMHEQGNIVHTKYADKTDHQGLGIRV